MNEIKKTRKRFIRDSFFCGRTIAILLGFLLIIKQIAITYTYGGQIQGGFLNHILLYLGFIGNDLMIMGIILLSVFINLNIHYKAIKRIINMLNSILILIFFIDIITILFFQSRLSLFDLYSFFKSSNSNYFFSYAFFAFFFFASLFGLSFILSQKFFKKRKEQQYQRIIAVGFFGLTFGISAINFITKNNTSIANNILALNIQTRKEQQKQFDTTSSKKYEDYFTTIQGKNQKPNIILVFAESFSTVDSKRNGWLADNFPLFDKIESEGITLTNAIANGCTSETAHIAALQWIEPRESPRLSANEEYDAYAAYSEPLPVFMNNHGYQTTFLSTVTLDFLNQKQFLENIKYKTIIGEEAFKDKKKYVFNAAPDLDLYNKALELISGYNTHQTKYFLTLQTISSHIPYDTPYGSKAKDMASYVDKSIYTFYQKLKKNWFFDNGILVIISDHRKMEAISSEEFKKFGLASKSKIIGTIVGKWIKPNTYNNSIIQHTDIYNSLKYLIGDQNVQVSKLFNNMFSNRANRDWGIRYCRFAEKTYIKINQDGSAARITSAEEFSEVNQYLQAYKAFQAEKLLGLKGITDYENPHLTWSQTSGFILIAHGGGTYKGRLPNTINTAMRAQKDWANALELDISYTKDNQNIVIHWPSLQTTACGPNKSITWFTLTELKRDCPLKNGEKLLSFEEFLTKIKDEFELFFVEIKVYDNNKAEQQTLDAINTVIKLNLQDKIIFSSYDRTANYIIWSHKKIRAGRDSFSEESQLIDEFPHEFYLVPDAILSRNTIEIAQAMRKKLVIYTLNTQQQIKNALELWVSYIMTDNIPLVKALIKRSKK